MARYIDQGVKAIDLRMIGSRIENEAAICGESQWIADGGKWRGRNWDRVQSRISDSVPS